MPTRRDLIKTAALGTVALTSIPATALAAEPSPEKRDPWRGLKMSVATYTFREFPLDVAIQGIRRVGLHYASIKDAHLSLKSTREERQAVVQKFKQAGITPLSCGNIAMPADEAGIRAIFEYARDAELPTIVCSPKPDSMPLLDRMVNEYDIRLAIHNHGPDEKTFPTPDDVWKVIEHHDERIGFCIDVGHTGRAGADPVKAILKYRSRLYDLHFKDVTRKDTKGAPIEGGRGVLDLNGILHALLKIGYSHLVSFEYEKDGRDPLPGLAESVGYSKGLLTK
jgi:sugar phosphate isomerase/epimerase